MPEQVLPVVKDGAFIVEFRGGEVRFPIPRLFDLNSNSSVWVAADTLDEAIHLYAESMLCTREEAIKEYIDDPHEVEFDQWRHFKYFDESVYPPTQITFEEQMEKTLRMGEKAPFLFAFADY